MDDKSSNKKDEAVGTSDIQIDLSSSSFSLVSTSTTSVEGAKAALDPKKPLASVSPHQKESETRAPVKDIDSEFSTTSTSLEEFRSSVTTSSSTLLESDVNEATTKKENVASTAFTSSSLIEGEAVAVAAAATPANQPTIDTALEQPPVQQPLTAEETKVKDEKAAATKIKFQTPPLKVEFATSESDSLDAFEESKDASVKFAQQHSGPLLKASKSRHVKLEPAGAVLKASKSQHARKLAALDDHDDDFFEETEESSDSTNLRMGDVFVYMVLPPDGGYGWFITLISFLCQVVVDGIMFAIGIVLPHIARDFQIPGSQVVLVASMQIGFYFLFGTVSSAFINKYGFRPVALTGCTVAIAVLSIATFSTNLFMMIFFYSILGGPSLSMIWVSSQLIIGYYFDKFRPIANGISCSGAGAGIMMFSYMNSSLVPTLGWRNLMRLHVGFLLLVFLMALTFLEVAPTKIGRVREPLQEESDSESSDKSFELTRYSRFALKVDDQQFALDDKFETVLGPPLEAPQQKSLNCCSNWLQKCFPSFYNWLEKRREQKAAEEATKRYVIKQDLIEKQDFFYMGPKDNKKDDEPADQDVAAKGTIQGTGFKITDADLRTISLEEFKNSHKRKTVINTLSTMHIKKTDDTAKGRKTYAELKETKKYPLLAYLSPQNLLHPKVRKAFSLLFDFRLMAIMEFRILLLSAFLFPMGFNIPFVYSTIRVKIDPSLAKLITPTIGFSNFAFRIASGFIAFKFRAYTTYICGGGMFFGGIAVLTSAFYGLDVVWFQFLYAICYGIAPAFYSTLRAIIYVQSLGLDKLTNAFGLTALAMGMGVFIGTTAGGILNELTGSYTASFIFAGICICTAGALKLVLPFLIKRAKNKQ